jgi:N-acetyl-anhydromuramyl-L-alanine amidase AmpD
MRHFDAWLNRRNGNYTKTSAFSINTDGTIHQHFDPKYYADFLGNEQDKCNISITLVNQGWLKLNELNVYVDWLGHIYSKSIDPIEKNWRNQRYWARYTNEQMGSLKELLNDLCKEFNIENKVIDHNVYDENVDIFKGVTFRSNYSKITTDVSPAFEIEKIK